MKFEIVNTSDPYTMEAADMEVAAVAICFLGSGSYALKGVGEDAGQDVPFFLFGSHDAWFIEKFGMNCEDTSNHVADHRAGELADAFDSVKLGRAERSSMNDIKAQAQALSGAVRERLKP